MPTQAAQPSRPSWLSSSNASKELWMLFATTLSFAPPLSGGAATDTCCAMVVLPSGSVTSVAPVSNSSQSSFPATASQDATSERLSSTLRSTTCALRMMIESLPSVISVLSPVAVTLGAAEVLENPALGAGAAAWRAVSARLTVPVLESEQAASANDSASATRVTFFILPPQQSLDGYAYDLAPEGWQAICRARSGRGTCGASTTRERPHMCSRHVAHSPASNRRKCRPL